MANTPPRLRNLSASVKALTRWKGASHPDTLAAQRELNRAKLAHLVAEAQALQAKIEADR